MITAPRGRSSAAGWYGPLLLGGLMVGLAAGGAPVRDALALSRAGLQDAQLWRLLSAHFVHLGPYHAALNLIGLAILAWLCPRPLRLREWLRRLLWLSLAVSAGVWLMVPELNYYVGFSGVLHGLFLLGLAPQARAGDRIAVACLACLGGKLIWEMVVGVPLSDEQAIGGRVVTQAHLFGTLAALAYGLTFNTFARGDRHP